MVMSVVMVLISRRYGTNIFVRISSHYGKKKDDRTYITGNGIVITGIR